MEFAWRLNSRAAETAHLTGQARLRALLTGGAVGHPACSWSLPHPIGFLDHDELSLLFDDLDLLPSSLFHVIPSHLKLIFGECGSFKAQGFFEIGNGSVSQLFDHYTLLSASVNCAW